jgi:hypothetical protein
MLKRLQMVVPVLVCLSLGAWAQDSMVLTSPGAWAAMGGVYTSPYGISIDSGVPTLLICDDYTTDISLGQSWTADATTLTAVDSGDVANLKFANAAYNTTPGIQGGTPPNTPSLATVANDYATAAVLAAELLSTSNVGTPSEPTETVGELSYALWGVFDAPLLTSTNTGYGTLSPGELAAAQNDLLAAQALVNAATVGGVTTLSNISVNGAQIASMTVYTPILPNGLASSQEFVTVAMPEASYPSVLALDLLAAAGLGFLFRRRISAFRS